MIRLIRFYFTLRNNFQLLQVKDNRVGIKKICEGREG